MTTIATITPAFTVPADNRILYYRRDRAECGLFSHFHPSPIAIDGETWPTVEHYYQSRKSFDSAYVEAIRAAVSPGMAKRLSASPDLPRRFSGQSWFRKTGRRPRADWYDVKLEIMRVADWAKFTQNPDLGERLLATGDAELIEDSAVDAYWGIGPDGHGGNWAGRVLMEIRERLRS